MRLVFLLATVAMAVPALAQEVDPLAPLEPISNEEPVATPETVAPRPATPPAPPRVIPRDWRGVLAAIDSGDWEAARLGIEAMPNGPLKPYARAKLYTAKDSPRVELQPLLALLQ